MEKLFAIFSFQLFLRTNSSYNQMVNYAGIISHCIEQELNDSQTSVNCYLPKNTNISCKGVSNLDPCRRECSRLVRNTHPVETGFSKDQFTLQNGSVCFSPRITGELPKETRILALVFQVTWQLVGYWDMMVITFGCVYGQPNITSNELAESKCCVDIPPRFADNSAFQISMDTLPYSTKSGDLDASEWIRLNELNDTTSEGNKLGTINLKNLKNGDTEGSEGVENEKATSGKVEDGMSTTGKIEEKTEEKVFSNYSLEALVGYLVLILVIFGIDVSMIMCLVPQIIRNERTSSA